jgi:hypothetical protein
MMQPMSKFDYSDLDGHLLQLLVAVVESAASPAPPSAWA